MNHSAPDFDPATNVDPSGRMHDSTGQHPPQTQIPTRSVISGAKARVRLELAWILFAATYSWLGDQSANWGSDCQRAVSSLLIASSGLLVFLMMAHMLTIGSGDEVRGFLIVAFGASLYAADAATKFEDPLATSIAIAFSALLFVVGWRSHPWTDRDRIALLQVAMTMGSSAIAGVVGLAFTLTYKGLLDIGTEGPGDPVGFHSVSGAAFGCFCAAVVGTNGVGNIRSVATSSSASRRLFLATAGYALVAGTVLWRYVQVAWALPEPRGRVIAAFLGAVSSITYSLCFWHAVLRRDRTQLRSTMTLLARGGAAGLAVGLAFLLTRSCLTTPSLWHLAIEFANGLIAGSALALGQWLTTRLAPQMITFMPLSVHAR